MFKDYLTTLNTVGAFYASGEGYVYEFAVNLETLNYLQTINLLDDEKLQITLEYMQTSIYFSINQSINQSYFLARDSIYVIARYMLSPVRLSVHHTGGSVKNG